MCLPIQRSSARLTALGECWPTARRNTYRYGTLSQFRFQFRPNDAGSLGEAGPLSFGNKGCLSDRASVVNHNSARAHSRLVGQPWMHVGPGNELGVVQIKTFSARSAT